MRKIRASNTTLMWLAAEYLGDVTQWTRIAKLNKRYDPIVTAPEDFLIPDPLPSKGTTLAK